MLSWAAPEGRPEVRTKAPRSARTSTATHGAWGCVATKPQGRICGGGAALGQRLFNGVDPAVDASDVHFLDAVGVARPRNTNVHISHGTEGASAVARQGHHVHARGLGRTTGFKDVAGIPTGADGQQHISGPSKRLDLARKHLVKSIVVAHASHDRHV